MKVQLSVWAQELPLSTLRKKPDPYAVLTVLGGGKQKKMKPVVLGKTEVLHNTQGSLNICCLYL